MADDDTETQTAPAPAPTPSGGLPPDVLTRLIQQLTTQQPAPPTGTPDDGTKPSWTGLLGSVLGGGQAPGYQLRGGQADTSGNRALLNFGINTLLASGPHAVRPDVLSAVATGLQGAQESLGLDQRLAGAQAATAYEQNRQQQQDKLARIKEAIPLLTLQQKMRAIQGLPATLGGGPGGGGSSVAGGSLSPFIATNLPDGVSPAEDQMVRTVIGEAGNQGTVGQQAVAAVIKNRMDAGKQGAQDVIFAPNQFEPWNNPKTRAGLEAIDPNSKQYQDILNNAVRPVMAGTAKDPTGGATHFYSPTAQKALGRDAPGWAQGQTPTVIGQHNFYKLPYSPQAPAPGQTAAAAPAPAPPGVGARPTLPPPEAPLAPGAGSSQVAGPGGPTSPGIPPSPPGSDATVADIRAGMVGAGADPNTLAVGPVPPGAAPGAATAGPAGPQAPAPGSYEEYRLLHPITPSADDLAGFRTTPDAEQIANIRKQAANAQTSYAAARANLDTAGMAKASDDYNTAIAKENELRQNAAKLGTDTRAKFMADQDKQRFDAWTAQQADARQQAQKQADQAAAIRLKEVEGEQARQTGAAASENSYVLDERKRFGLERDSARTNIDDLQMLTALSNAAGTSTPLENIRVGDKSGRDFMVQWGLGTEAAQKQWGAQQAFEAAVNKTVTGLRQGMSMGQLSDRDMAFIQHMAPNLLQHPQTRADIIAYLEQAQYRKLQYTDAVEQLWDGGKGMSWGQAKREAQKQQSDYVPKVPNEYTGWDAPTRKAWLQTNARPGQLMRGPDGRLSIYQPPQQGGQ